MTNSRRSMVRSAIVYVAASAQPLLDRNFLRHDELCNDTSSGGPRPVPASSSRRDLASTTYLPRSHRLPSPARRVIMMTPPTNSLTANCQPISTTSTMPSSITRLVEANMNTVAATKSAPFTKRDFAIALAAYEHEEEPVG